MIPKEFGVLVDRLLGGFGIGGSETRIKTPSPLRFFGGGGPRWGDDDGVEDEGTRLAREQWEREEEEKWQEALRNEAARKKQLKIDSKYRGQTPWWVEKD